MKNQQKQSCDFGNEGAVLAILLTLTKVKNYGLIVKKQAVNMPPVLTN
jgi:hypothetical protein